ADCVQPAHSDEMTPDQSSDINTNQASTLAWGTRMKGFIICFVLGVFCSILHHVPDWSVSAADDHVC
uniref:SFT2 domain containing 2b n=1 Tax=Sparus aurata TaxID=8175 RepID=A0A671UHR1_SPAAU